MRAGGAPKGGEWKRAAAWSAAGALAALAALAAAAGAGTWTGPEDAAAPSEGGGGAGEAGEAGRPAGAAQGEEAGGGAEGGGGQEPDVVMPSKSSRPGCEEDDACYVPPAVEVAPGGSVTWRNDDVAFHTVTSGEYGSPDGMFDSGHMDPGEEFTVVFDGGGGGGKVVAYHCTLHPWMKGAVAVGQAAQ